MLLYISVCLRTRQDSISYSFILYIVQKLELRNCGTPKLLRNWGTVEFRNYSEITPKLWDWDRDRGTMELLRNYSEITPKLRNRGIPKLLRNYGTGTVAVEL